MKVIFALTMIVIGESAIRFIDQSSAPGSASLPAIPLASLPKSIGAWNGEDAELEAGMQEGSGATVMLNRCYHDPSNGRVLVNAGIWTDYISQIPHRPEVCYANAGWEIEDRRVVQIARPADKQPIDARLLSFNKHGQQILILYWVQLGAKTVMEDSAFRLALQQTRGAKNGRPPAVKVMLQTDAHDPARAEIQLTDFAAQLAPWFDRLTEETTQ